MDRQRRLLEPDRLDASGNVVKGTEVEGRAGEFERFGGGFRGEVGVGGFGVGDNLAGSSIRSSGKRSVMAIRWQSSFVHTGWHKLTGT